MLEVHVSAVNLEGPMKEIVVPQSQFQVRSCPICRREEDSIVLSEVCAGDKTSMVSAFCLNCEHRYFRKMPSLEWLDRYYAEEFDAGLTHLTNPPKGIKSVVKKIPAVEKIWGRFAKLIGRETLGLRQIRAFLEGILETNGSYYLVRPDIRKILEIGCGYGGKLAMFRRQGYEVCGIEASRQRAAECRRQGLKVLDCPVTNLGPVHQLGPFDFVYSVHVLEHITDVSNHLAQVAHLIRHDGMLYIQVPNLWLGETLFMQSHAAIHCHTFSVHSLAELMRQHGFTPVRVLADNNLHILATKSTSRSVQPSWKDSASYSQLLDCLSWVQAADSAEYCITFDHAQVSVRRVADGSEVYKRDPCFSIQQTPYRHSVEFSVNGAAESNSFPVRFIYERADPPVWVKRQ